MLTVFREAQLQETQVFFIIKIYALQVRFVDRKRTLYCFLENMRDLGIDDRVYHRASFYPLYPDSPTGTEEDRVKTGHVLLEIEAIV